MAWRHTKNRWLRRWLITIIVWMVPVMLVGGREFHEEMAYNWTEMQQTLTAWTFTDAERASRAPAHCHGTPDDARAHGCPQAVLLENAQRHQAALDDYALRRATLAGYLWHAFVGYWIVPAAVLFAVGTVIGGVRRALRRPVLNAQPKVKAEAKPADQPTPTATAAPPQPTPARNAGNA